MLLVLICCDELGHLQDKDKRSAPGLFLRRDFVDAPSVLMAALFTPSLTLQVLPLRAPGSFGGFWGPSARNYPLS
ncbi:hypothetical protein ACSS6W_001966 [Trichoderma asperelloides]